MEVVVPSDLNEIIPDGTEVSLQIVREKVNVFDADSRVSVIREGA